MFRAVRRAGLAQCAFRGLRTSTVTMHAQADGVQTLGVVGAGQMGAGIAQVAAAAEIEVVCVDVSEDSLARGRKSIESSLARLVKKGAIDLPTSQAIAGRVSYQTEMKSLSNASVVVEAATENEDLKKKIFQQLDDVMPPGAMLATNTSSISITRIGHSTKRPEAVIGMHFMNPVPLMKLVEIIRGIATSDETFALCKALSERMGKTVATSQDRPGFIANRILMPMINEAFYALMEGVGAPEDIDTAMKLGTNQPMGPLVLADFIGLDTCLAIMRVLHDGLGDSKYRPCPLLVQYVDAGWYGRKSGRGVYKY
eukprot:Hpha_TRINITY_DN15143_c2_g6::TRINITY_DN15143_c2_g6_i1::g.127519::m.127519/K00074/paaH, hbd, fadB, mmgB; 3-hydroxybutyryl-CoA dehydrogenase